MHNELNSVEDIDAMLDDEFKLSDSDNSKDFEETNGNVENQESGDDENQELDTDNETKDDEVKNDEVKNDEGNAKEPETVPANKLSADDKKDFAFGKMRKENSDLKNQLDERNEQVEFLSKLAAQYGYTDIKKFQEDFEKARVKQEAEAKGLDPVLYAQLQASNKRIEELEKKQRDTDLVNKVKDFREAVDKAVADYNLGEEGRNEIFNKLEEAGYSVETLLSIPNPEILIKGILSDKIAEFSKQEQIDKFEKLDNLSDNRHDGLSPDDNKSVDDIIAEEMKQYKADNYFD